MKQPLVLLVAPTPPPLGGIARWTKLLLEENREKPRARIWLIDSKRWLRTPHARASAATRAATGGVEMIPVLARTLWQLMRRRPDVLHLTTSGNLGFVRDRVILSLAHAFGVGTVVHMCFGRIPELLTTSTVESRLLRHVLNSSDRVIVLDEPSQKALKCAGFAAELIPNGVTLPILDEWERGTGERPYVLFVGWVIPAKGILELARAWQRLCLGNADLVIAGPVEPDMAEQVLRYAGGDLNVRLLGSVDTDEVMRLMAGCTMLVLPSHSEGFPFVVLEAMAMGKPVIATPVGAVPEMLSADAGRLVPVDDDVALAATIEELLWNPALRAALGAKAHERVLRDYSIERACDRYAAVWQDVSRSA